MTDPSIDRPPAGRDLAAGSVPGVAAVDQDAWVLELEAPTEAELAGLWPDPFAGPPDGQDGWLADLCSAEIDALAQAWAAEEGACAAEPVPAGFTHGDRTADDGAVGFAAGGALDVLTPGPVLAGFAQDAFDSGLGQLSDDELVGVLCAARRLSSWQAAMEFRAVAELDSRRKAQAPRPGASLL